ncbi:MAG: hypothetical protein IT462_01105 [Planctomycetes bacterium]|nr:hypothetical protein [Planctomycetota bacterium]
MKLLAAFVLGLLFAAGLGISGMSQPAVVQGFLDITGNWNPALLVVMATAVPVYGLIFRLKRGAPLLGGNFLVNMKTGLDWRLIVGAAIFGIGWGLSGICPGPAVVNLGKPGVEILGFVAAMLAGMAIYRVIEPKPAPVPEKLVAVEQPRQ